MTKQLRRILALGVVLLVGFAVPAQGQAVIQVPPPLDQAVLTATKEVKTWRSKPLNPDISIFPRISVDWYWVLPHRPSFIRFCRAYFVGHGIAIRVTVEDCLTGQPERYVVRYVSLVQRGVKIRILLGPRPEG
jgi:hypothetical protein